jgi:pyruvate kinase
MSFPGKVLNQVYLSEADKADLLFGIEHGVDFVACSFVSRKQDLLDVRAFLDANGGGKISLIAKLENQSGIDNIEEICEACEGIMIGRGDMGVEIPYEELPAVQKQLITKCRLIGKRVITATEMLESMIYNARPTRAEISDVANAVYDGTSAIMLSGETAAGKHPVEAVAVMAKIAEATEQKIDYAQRFHDTAFQTHSTVDAISHAVCAMAIDVGAKAIVACSLSGRTVRMISRFRAPVDILGVTTSQAAMRKLALSWGVVPAMSIEYTSTDVLFFVATQLAREKLGLQPGDKIVITGGVTNGKSGNTNLIKVEVI